MVRFTNLISLAVPFVVIACATMESKLHSRADAGDPEAQYQLASLYWDGKEVDQDRNEALKWYQLAAQHGHPDAQVKVAEVYEMGQGVSQDYLRASQWYAKAAEKGDSDAQVRLATLYIKGYGVPQNYVEAIKLRSEERRVGKECRYRG